MSIIRKMLSTEVLPDHLTNRQRFLTFSELFEHFSNTGEFDPSDEVPFNARMNSVGLGNTLVGRCEGTFLTVKRERRQILAATDDLYCLARNTGGRDALMVHGGREFNLRPGCLTLLKMDTPFLAADGSDYKRFTNINMPAAPLRAMVSGLDDLVGCELAPGGALSLALDYSGLLLDHNRATDEAGPQIAAHLLDLIALGLGARRDAAEAAQHRGLRAIRLNSVLEILHRRFTEPGFSAQKLAAAAGLSERYVNELLFDDGASFTARLLELRLRKAIKLLQQSAAPRISDVAFACGFNDLSYFNRCFRRRFGLTPSDARGHRSDA